MDLIVKASGGQNIIARPQGRPAFYAASSLRPAIVEVYWRYADEPAPAARLVGRYLPGQEVSLPFTPVADKNVILSTVSVSAAGVRSVRDLRDAAERLVVFQRETAAPTIGQNTDATADEVTIGISGFSTLVIKRRLRVAEALTGGGALDSPTETIFEYGANETPKFLVISRAGALTPVFTLMSAVDPAAHGFTKTGTGTTEENAPGWRIDTTGSDAATYYSKTGWPAGAFANGFTIELLPPTVTTSDNASPADCVCLQVEDGAHRFKLQFDAGGNVALNGGAPHAHAGAKIRLAVDVGGATADLWIGDTQIESNTAGAATATSSLKFGDLVTTDDADAVWSGFVYQLAHVPVLLPSTVYVAVAHSSGGDWTPDSNIVEITFAAEGSGAGGSTGDFDPEPKDTYDII